ncbi:hypothetical protein CK485_02060 [Streptomyces sp. ICBB 8177]|nr:hypothetical protein CK485_02060 [Streptomyces sp. ICBB 8177]
MTGLSGLGVSVATAAGAIYTARAGRRTRGQERRDDFAAITDRLDLEVRRLERRVDEQEIEARHSRRRSRPRKERFATWWGGCGRWSLRPARQATSRQLHHTRCRTK